MPRDSPANGFPYGCAGERAPSNSVCVAAEAEAAGVTAWGVTSPAALLIASSEDGYCLSSFAGVPYFAALVSLNGCILAIR